MTPQELALKLDHAVTKIFNAIPREELPQHADYMTAVYTAIMAPVDMNALIKEDRLALEPPYYPEPCFELCTVSKEVGV